MRRLEVIGEHTVDTSLLTPRGFVLDAGCRDFMFARGMVERGCRVMAIDADPTVENPDIDGVAYLNRAVAATPGSRTLVMSKDPQARYLTPVGFTSMGGERVEAVTVLQLMTHVGAVHWDVVKLDVEGSEYDILAGWPGPISTQLSIEFHEHCAPRPQAVYDSIFAHLGQWYDVAQHVKEARHCCAPNYWDSLFILRGAK